MKIFIVAMPGSGNFGDDLISKILLSHLVKKFNPLEIGILVGNDPIDYPVYKDVKISLFNRPNKKSIPKYFINRKLIIEFLKDCDLLVIGGGGLLQDTHYLFTIHKYLKYIRYINKNVMLLGIGAGPLRFWFNKFYLKTILNSKNLVIQLRDNDSKNLLQSINVNNNISISTDIVEGSYFFYDFPKINNSDIILGCSIRKWNDINLLSLIGFLNSIIYQYSVSTIKFFVFENKLHNQEEKEFAINIINLLDLNKLNVKLVVYNELSESDFVSELSTVNLAIASRYHANIIWQKMSIPTIPIGYAPKVFNLYSKFGEKAFDFNQLVKNSKIDFINLPEIKNNSNYSIPDLEGSVNLNSYQKLVVSFFSILEFFSSSFNSLFIRIVRR